ncbi:DUF397 domain-containing protein [Streptomyces sp. NPDC051561]|uniref:DUF397 domain-containing protein n=1 Tax=Streptomyces sp. NPDC051561 TaxID=3365658 RepID=UPI0037AC0B8D
MAPEAAWFKSSYSSGAEGNCVEVAFLRGQVGVRDTKSVEGPTLIFRGSAFSNFVASLSVRSLTD